MGVPLSPTYRNGQVSFWRGSAEQASPRPPLEGDLQTDVAIVGAGYTGLWTAYYLKTASPGLRIAVLEARHAGYGASGRNGGWLSGELGGSRERYAAESSRDAVLRMQRAVIDSIDEVTGVAEAEGIDADITRSGLLYTALTQSQHHRLADMVAHRRAWGSTEDDLRLLTGAEMRSRITVSGARAMAFSPHGARIHPYRLATGLAAAVERLGVRIYENTPVLGIAPRTARTAHGTVSADYVLRATEGFTAGLPGARRQWLPMNSVMIATEPLPEQTWQRIGWNGSELLGTQGHAFLYAQRTRDGRIAIGGRGNPYRYGSRTDTDAAARPGDVRALWNSLTAMFPDVGDSAVAHSWCGALGVARDWCATVRLDHRSGLGTAGGYAGHGLAMANLAGRALRDLVLRHDTDLTALPCVGRTVRTWEPEPLRWIGVQALYALYRRADRNELHGPDTSRLARIADAVSGR
ncbi:FAD-dependent oxidoreductase [Streptomyces sp. SID8352]|uniref:NAD(P)/FAD-dependent oxidoreductase n=1 Tax=unclassified Streptomyces TaxID=2593676 RepID=UPI00136D3E6C|nr:FAD-dependent oxidoreductase [Streptomyces sp. SID8352]MYU22465.1 FAD-dependent oxidoreductase [Streptomyces sp. SID8352]